MNMRRNLVLAAAVFSVGASVALAQPSGDERGGGRDAPNREQRQSGRPDQGPGQRPGLAQPDGRQAPARAGQAVRGNDGPDRAGSRAGPDDRGAGQARSRDAGPRDGGPAQVRGPDRNYARGDRLPPPYRGRHYVIDDWRDYRLEAPPRGYQWVQVGADYALIAIATGVISQIILGN